MRAFGLLALLLLPRAAHAGAKAEPAAVKLVESFVKTPTAELPPEKVPAFLAVDPAALPKKLREPFEAKRLELLALKKNEDGKRKPPLRLLGQPAATTACEPPKTMASVAPLLQAGFDELRPDEAEWLGEQTGCSECELRTEFTLTLVVTPAKKKKEKPDLHYLMHQQDPLMVLVAGHRSGANSLRGTSFFGIGGSPKCR